MHHRLLPVLIVASTALVLTACGSSGDDKSPTSDSTSAATTNTTPVTTATTAQPAGGCRTVSAQEPIKRTAKRPSGTLDASKTYRATFRTSCGDIEITLDVRHHPKTASSFASLVKGGFYDGLGVVRVVPDFVLQAGDPNGDGSGDAGYQVTERPGDSATYRKGVVAMAKTATDPPGASSSQFFIVTGPDAGLPPEYAIAGTVTKGIDVAELIGAIPPDGGQDGPPTKPVIIDQATLAVG